MTRDAITVNSTPAAELTVPLFHDLLRLRTDIFVVEQTCPYPELDGRDLDVGTVHLWIEEDNTIIATLRLLDDGESIRIGRVATHVDARRRGLAQLLVREVLETTGGPWVLSAQTYLQGWYERLGFVVDGLEFLEDGIAHVPMRRD